MTPLPYASGAGQAHARTLDVTNPRSVFVWITEARDVFDDLLTVAADATRPPRRRKLSRRAAVSRFRRARSAADWLLSLPLAAPVAPVASASEAPPFEAWAE
jgi:hypothetical protein